MNKKVHQIIMIVVLAIIGFSSYQCKKDDTPDPTTARDVLDANELRIITAIHKYWQLEPTNIDEFVVNTNRVIFKNRKITGLDVSFTIKGNINTFPPELFELDSLDRLNIAGNEFDNLNGFDATTLDSLKYLNIANNLFTTLPSYIATQTELEELNIASNKFVGAVPTEIYSLNKLKKIHLNNNKFNGAIPNGLCALDSLREYVLDSNEFTGGIPRTLFSKDKADSLFQRFNARGNLLSFDIDSLPGLGSYTADSTFVALTKVISLNGNNITGTIPLHLKRFEGDIRSQRNNITLPTAP